MLSWHNLETTVPYLETTELPYNERGTAKAIVSEKGGYEKYIHFNIIFIFAFYNFSYSQFNLSLPRIAKKGIKNNY